MKNILYSLLFCSLLFTACEDIIELNTPEGKRRLVVDGLLTDQPELQTVSLKYTAPYFSGEQTPAASGALVIVKENGSYADTLQETQAGIYQKAFRGQAGNEYRLYIKTVNGEEYLSHPQRLQPVPAIDSLYAEFNESRYSDESGYLLFLRTSDPEEVTNFYRWRLFINGALQQGTDNLYIASDKLVNGNSGLGLAFFRHRLQQGDSARVEQLSVSGAAYDFMSLLKDQASGGSQFSTPPAPVRGNVVALSEEENFALGFFMVSAVSGKKITITPAE